MKSSISKALAAFLLVCLISITHALPTTTPEPETEDTTGTEPDESTTFPDREGTPETPIADPLPPFQVEHVTIQDKYENATKYPGFSRDCENSNDCQYRNALVKSTAHLICANKVCICENDRRIADISVWKLEWSNEQCKIALSGPCGSDTSKNGNLTMSCQSGLDCIEGRCRDPLKLSQTPLNHSCNENIDCMKGLECKVTGFYFGESRTCVAPDTPSLKGFEKEVIGGSSTEKAGSETTPGEKSTDSKDDTKKENNKK